SAVVAASAALFGVYAGSTRLPFEVFGRHRSGTDSLERCGLARPGAPTRDACSVLVMMGAGVRVPASALSICRRLLWMAAPPRRHRGLARGYASEVVGLHRGATFASSRRTRASPDARLRIFVCVDRERIYAPLSASARCASASADATITV